MTSKKLINHPDDCVDEALEGLVMTNPGLLILGKRVVVNESVSYTTSTCQHYLYFVTLKCSFQVQSKFKFVPI